MLLYFHDFASVPVLPAVTADNGTTSVSENGNVYLPKTPEQYTHDLDGNMLSDGEVVTAKTFFLRAGGLAVSQDQLWRELRELWCRGFRIM